MSLRVSVCSAQDLLESGEQLLVLLARADGDADPARDRLTIVMANQDLALAQGRDHLRGRHRRSGEDEIRGRVDDLESQLAQRPGELAAALYDRLAPLPV